MMCIKNLAEIKTMHCQHDTYLLPSVSYLTRNALMYLLVKDKILNAQLIF